VQKSINTKMENYIAFDAGLWGNQVRQWTSISLWFKEAISVRGAKYMIRSKTPGQLLNTKPMGVGRLMKEWTANGYSHTNYYINECIDNTGVILNAEVMRGPRGLDIMYSTHAGTMRDGMCNGWCRVTGLAAKLLLQSTLCDKGYARLKSILEDYPGHIVELTVCRQSIGLLGWRTMIWEVRNY